MRTIILILAFAFAGLFAATPAQAQRRVPDAGMWGAGASIGAAVPSDPSLDNGLQLTGNIEGYVTPRVSIRGQLGGASTDIVGRNFSGRVNPLFATGNVVYNWEGGLLHPFVTGGIGMYRFRADESGAPKRSDTKAGFNLGGGIEYFFTRHATMTGELLYHKVDEFNTPLATFNDGSFWSFALGAKAYFGR
jgi:opacity protein-like surface antigen